MQHNWPVAAVVASDVLQAKAFRQVEVALNGAELPLASDRITHIDVDLWSVERSVAFLYGILNTVAIQCFAKRSRCLVPNFI